jgi:hypothetical protein
LRDIGKDIRRAVLHGLEDASNIVLELPRKTRDILTRE